MHFKKLNNSCWRTYAPESQSNIFLASTNTQPTGTVVVVIVEVGYSNCRAIVTRSGRRRKCQVTLLTGGVARCPVYADTADIRQASCLASGNRHSSVSSTTGDVGICDCTTPCVPNCARSFNHQTKVSSTNMRQSTKHRNIRVPPVVTHVMYQQRPWKFMNWRLNFKPSGEHRVKHLHSLINCILRWIRETRDL